MGKKVKVKLNSSGIRKLLRSDEVLQECKDYAYSARARLGDGYSVNYRKGKVRANAEIAAESPEAIRENLKKNTLLKAVTGR